MFICVCVDNAHVSMYVLCVKKEINTCTVNECITFNAKRNLHSVKY